MNQQSMFPDAIDVEAGDVATNHKAKILQVMRLYSERGKHFSRS